jgi:glycosyltransferase involved in cell wall biosynthesis
MVEVSPNGFSIVLCTYNGKSRLTPTLAHIAALKIPSGYEVELVVIDNASVDGTEAFVKEYWVKLGAPFLLTIMTEQRPGKGYAVETGYDATNYSYILTVDDDNWLECDYLVKSVNLFNIHPDIGILQGLSEAVFEGLPPLWFDNPYAAKQHVVGGIQDETGYLPATHFHVWGAGLVIYRKDWVYLRQHGFSFLTSKMSGKAAGEDSELGLGLWLLGRRIYYSSDLKFKHFMPSARMHWNKLKQNFEILGYVNYYFDLYTAVIEAAKSGKKLTRIQIKKYLFKNLFKQFRRLTVKQHLSFLLKPQQEYYQLMLTERYSQLNWISKLSGSVADDIEKIEKWVLPVLLERGQLLNSANT